MGRGVLQATYCKAGVHLVFLFGGGGVDYQAIFDFKNYCIKITS